MSATPKSPDKNLARSSLPSRTRSNTSEKPLSEPGWLAIHDAAKHDERRKFARRVAALEPEVVVDIGSGPGYWLEHLHNALPQACSLIGVEIDEESIEFAYERSKNWKRDVEFVCLDINANPSEVPSGDVTTMFNVLEYLDNPKLFLATLLNRPNPGTHVIRSWDTAMIRYGPMPNDLRLSVDRSLHTSVGSSQMLDFFGMDRIITLLSQLPYENVHREYEKFECWAPFVPEVHRYVRDTIQWANDHCSDLTRAGLTEWVINSDIFAPSSDGYIVELDLVVFAS